MCVGEMLNREWARELSSRTEIRRRPEKNLQAQSRPKERVLPCTGLIYEMGVEP